jgi:uncharacterized damage-inducible protein DinB
MTEDLRFPIGKFDPKIKVTPEMRREFIQAIEELPVKIRKAVDGLDDEQIDARYRPEGWTVRQLVHHVADSHMNSFCRFKLGLTENTPTIKPYDEALWAEMADSKNAPIDISLNLIDAVHARWTILLKSMRDEDFARKINHPERGAMNLSSTLALYDWHGKHHTAHITNLRKRNSW